MILNRLLITAALMLFSMTLTAQKTYLPLTVGTDTIGFFEGNAFDPYKKKYLFKSTQADKFVQSHPDLDFEWSTNEPTYELNLKWNLFSISVPAFSQDLVEYDKGTFIEYDKGIFTRNGERLEMYQIDDLTLLHKAGRGNVRRANRFDLMYKDEYVRISNNTLNFIGGAATGFSGGIGVLTGGIFAYASLWGWDADYALPSLFLVPGAGLSVVSYKAFSRIALSKKGCLRKRDKQFNKVADKLNEAIVRAGPTVQSSNQ